MGASWAGWAGSFLGAPRERMQFSVEETRIICLCSPRRWEQVAGDSELLY